MSAQKIILGTVSGMLAGVAVGLLIAPMTGEETRQKISSTADEMATGVKDKFSQLSKKASMKAEDLKVVLSEKIEGISDDVRERILKLLDSNKDNMDQGKMAIDKGVEKGKEALDRGAEKGKETLDKGKEMINSAENTVNKTPSPTPAK